MYTSKMHLRTHLRSDHSDHILRWSWPHVAASFQPSECKHVLVYTEGPPAQMRFLWNDKRKPQQQSIACFSFFCTQTCSCKSYYDSSPIIIDSHKGVEKLNTLETVNSKQSMPCYEFSVEIHKVVSFLVKELVCKGITTSLSAALPSNI